MFLRSKTRTVPEWIMAFMVLLTGFATGDGYRFWEILGPYLERLSLLLHPSHLRRRHLHCHHRILLATYQIMQYILRCSLYLSGAYHHPRGLDQQA